MVILSLVSTCKTLDIAHLENARQWVWPGAEARLRGCYEKGITAGDGCVIEVTRNGCVLVRVQLLVSV